MRAALLTSVGAAFEIVDDLDCDDPRDDEVKVRITHCGVCHSDLHAVDGLLPTLLPAVCGHEPAGIVESVGAAVTAVGEGDRVVLTSRPTCGRCYFCVRGQANLCRRAVELHLGSREDGSTPLSRHGAPVWMGMGLGAFAERVVTRESAVVVLPPDMPLDLAAVMGCALQAGVGAVLNTASVEAGATVLIVGLGGVGMAVAQGARLAGASLVIGVDPVEGRRAMAGEFGVDSVIDPAGCDVVGAVLQQTGGIGVDYSFEVVGRASLVGECIQATRPGGQITMLGVGGLAEVVSVPLTTFAIGEKHLSGCLFGSTNPRRDIPRMVDLWRAGRLDLEAIVTRRRPLAEINEAFDDLRAGRGLRTVVEIAPV